MLFRSKLLCDNKNRNEVQKLLIFYFYKLLSNDRLELLKNEMNFYKNEIEVTSNFLVLTSKYFQKLGKPNGEIIKLYKESLSIANYKEEKMNAIKGLWCYLSTINTVTHKSLFEELITMNIELANDTD